MKAVVVGAGLAGLTAALRLARAGVSVVLVAKGVGGLPLGPATLDVLGYGPELVSDPLAAVAALAGPPADGPREPIEAPPPADLPAHPYAVLGAAVVESALGFLSVELGPELLLGDPHRTLLLPTAAGGLRPTCLAQPSMLAGEGAAGSRFAIVGLRRLRDFQADLVAGNLSRTVLPDGGRLHARAVWVDVPVRAEADSSALAHARAIDDGTWLAGFVSALAPLLEAGETVGLPAVLGWRRPRAWQELSERLGHPLFEIPLPPPSVPGLRLDAALNRAVRDAGVRVVPGSRVVAATTSGDRLASLRLATAGAGRELAADAFVLATGGWEATGLRLDSHGRARETTLDLPVHGVPAALGAGSGRAVFSAGLAVDEWMRPLDLDGVVCRSNLFAAGGLLGGADRTGELCGDGIAVASAVRAADSLAGGVS